MQKRSCDGDRAEVIKYEALIIPMKECPANQIVPQPGMQEMLLILKVEPRDWFIWNESDQVAKGEIRLTRRKRDEAPKDLDSGLGTFTLIGRRSMLGVMYAAHTRKRHHPPSLRERAERADCHRSATEYFAHQPNRIPTPTPASPSLVS